jgi:hypothetical protein
MRLAHPQRCSNAWTVLVPPWEDILTPYTWNELRKAFSQPKFFTPDIINTLSSDPRNHRLAQFVSYASTDDSSTELGGTYGTALYWRQLLFPQPQFVIEDSLVEMLEHTDISDDLPMSALKPPYPRCFIEMGKSRICEQRVPNLTSGLHILEGAYIEEGESSHLGAGIFITFTGSPIGKENVLDDATDSIFLPYSAEDELIRTVLESARAKSQQLAAQSNLKSSPAEFTQYAFSCLKFLVKVLLYLGLPEARKTLHAEHSEFKKQIAAKKNPAKRAKAEKQLNRLSDYILVTAPPAAATHGTESGGPGMKRHWRRGHYRWQPHGPQNTLRKVIFLQPMLIGTPDAGVANVPSYRVR